MPLSAPNRIASPAEIAAESRPIRSETRPPYQIIEKMSRPSESVPNGNSRLGGVL